MVSDCGLCLLKTILAMISINSILLEGLLNSCKDLYFSLFLEDGKCVCTGL